MAINENTIFGFDIGNEVNLPINKTEGRFKITQDTHNMYLDIDEDTRISIGAGRYAPTWARKILSILAIQDPVKHNYSLEVDGDVVNSNNDPLTRQAWEINDIVNLDGAGHISNAYKITQIDVSVTNKTKTGYKSIIILEDIMPDAAKSVVGIVSPKEGETEEDIYNSENWAYVPGKINGELLTQYSDYQFKDSYIFGSTALASGWGSIAAGRDTRATGNYATAFGRETEAGYAGFAAGVGAKAGTAGIALGNNVQALGNSSFASGSNTRAYAAASRAGGKYTEAWMPHSTAEGYYTIAKAHCQFVIGEYNKILEGPNDDSDPNKALFIVGNGTSSNRSNAFEVYRNGGAKFQRFNLTSDDGGVLIKDNHLYFIKNDNNQYEIYHTGNFDINEHITKVNNLENYYLKSTVDSKLEEKVDLSGSTMTGTLQVPFLKVQQTLEDYDPAVALSIGGTNRGGIGYSINSKKIYISQYNNEGKREAYFFPAISEELTENKDYNILIADSSASVSNLTISTEKQYNSQGNFGIDLNNSDIININSLWFKDLVNEWDEGIMFARSNNNWDKIYAREGELYFTPDIYKNAKEKDYIILHTGNWYGRGIGNYNVTFGAENGNTFGNVDNNAGCVMFGGGNKILSTDSPINYIKIFGTNNTASHYNANLFGTYLTSTASNQTIVGKYNNTSSQDIFIVANGLDNSNRKNVFSISTTGKTTIQGNLTLTNGSIDLFTANTSGEVYVYKELSIGKNCIITNSGNIQARSLNIKTGDTDLFKVDSSGNATLYKNLTIGGTTTFGGVISGQGFTTTNNGDIITQGRLWLTGLSRAAYAGKWKCRITVNEDGMVVTDNWTQIEE